MLLRIVIFLLSYVFWIVGIYRSHKKYISEGTSRFFQRNLFINSLLMGLAIAIFPALHSGSWNIKLAIAFLLISQSSLLFIPILKWFVNLDESTVMACSRWTGLFMGITSRGFLKFVLLLTIVAIVGYPVTVVLTMIWSPQNLPAFAIKVVVVTYGLIAIPTVVWTFGNIVSHPFWKDTVRGQLFAILSSSFFTLFSFLVLAMWAFGLTGTGKAISLLGGTFSFSPRLMGGLLAGMIALYLLPHFRGVLWGGRILKTSLSARARLMERLIAILKAPLPQTCVNRIDGFQRELESGLAEYTQADPIYGLATALEDPSFEPDKFRIEREAFLIARGHDFRFDQLDWVKTLIASISMAASDLRSKSTDETRLGAAEKWASFYQLEQDSVRRSIDEISKSKTPVLIVFGFLLSPIASAILSKCGELIWSVLSRAFP